MQAYETLEFNIILQNISEFALSENAKNKLLSLAPSLDERMCRNHMKDTTEAKMVLESIGTPPLVSMKELESILLLAEKGSMLMPQQLLTVASFIHSCKRVAAFLRRAEHLNIDIAYYGRSFTQAGELCFEIERSIRNNKVDDAASKTLQDVRRKIEKVKLSIKAKMEAILRTKREYLSDSNVVSRNGRLALPVKKEHKSKVSGVVVDSSGTGSTLFIEPSAIGKLQVELSTLEIEEDNEQRKILYTLSCLVDEHQKDLRTNMHYMEILDFFFAKAKYSCEINAREVPVLPERCIKIIKGRHPLLNQDVCVPLDFMLGDDYTGVVITGPNTGGKTVALKAVGLFSLMAQCGLHVPVEEGSVFSMHANFLCDIGDGQSISENLSTFSSHIQNIVSILKQVTHESLVLLDELGSGTDPAEGMGIAISILEELRKKECLFLATTHYPEIKEYAKNTPSLINARMDFDKENLKPLYRLQVGEAGESCALSIAERLGLPKHLLERARREAYRDGVSNMETQPCMSQKDMQKHEKKAPSKIIKDIPTPKNSIKTKFDMGDSVTVAGENATGIVYKPANDKGDFVVQIKGEKKVMNHTKLTLKTKASELYPPDYDFSIVFDTIENRKARHKMGKGHHPDLVIVHDEFS